MTKLHYFLQDAADMDDYLLNDAIKLGSVPTTCLCGGVMVQEAIKAQKDPCTICPCPKREKCGGRAQVESLETQQIVGDARFMFNSESAARKIERRQHARDLIRAGIDAMERKKS